MLIFWSESRGNTVEKAKWSLWLRKREVDVRLVKWIAEKRKLSRSGHFLVLFLCGRVIEGKKEVTNRWAAEWLQLFSVNKYLESDHWHLTVG